MTIIWDISSQESVSAEEVGEAEAILKWGIFIPLRLGFLKKCPSRLHSVSGPGVL